MEAFELLNHLYYLYENYNVMNSTAPSAIAMILINVIFSFNYL